MLTALCLSGALLCASAGVSSPTSDVVPVRSAVYQGGDKRAIKVIRTWLKLYRKGEWDLTAVRSRNTRGRGGVRRQPKPAKKIEYLIERHKLVPSDFNGPLDYLTEIDLLCRQARETRKVEAARAILEVAAVGLDFKTRYNAKMAPNTVRSTGERHLRRMRSAAIATYLVEAARGNPGGPSRFKRSMQAAALRALGARRLHEHRQLIVDQLAQSDAMVRTAAAGALGRIGDAVSIKDLALRLAKEGHPTVVIEILSAIERIHLTHQDDGQIKTEWMQMAVIEAGRALGRSDSWRPDMAIVDFLEKFRYRDSIPILIKMLERYANDSRAVRGGRLSGRLKIRVHEVLAGLTGTRISADQPAKWVEFWETNKSSFELASASKPKPRADGKGTVSGFFNIPIQGKRIVFVIDVSGSMAQPMQTSSRSGGTRAGGSRGVQDKKIEIAKRELWKAVRSLPQDTKFNVIEYSAKFRKWSNKLVFATAQTKARFKVWLDARRPMTSTNIYDAMKEALKIKSLVYGQHYDSNVDEVFLLSDGLPNTGEVTAPGEILRIITETNKFSRVRINTVYLEGGGGGRGGFGGGGADLMRQLAERNGGKFVKP